MDGLQKFIYLILLVFNVECSDITKLALGDFTDALPAAFGDFNSDELTDVFVLNDNGYAVEILLANEEEPLLRPAPQLSCSFREQERTITSVVPGDFDGDALMDLLVTTIYKPTGQRDHTKDRSITYIYVIWGGASYVNCSNDHLIEMVGQPLAIDYNQDMIIDLFGEDIDKKRAFWVFNKDRSEPKKIEMPHHNKKPMTELKKPHAHAFLGKNYFNFLVLQSINTFLQQYWLVSHITKLAKSNINNFKSNPKTMPLIFLLFNWKYFADLNEDCMADLFITTNENFEIWYGKEEMDPLLPRFIYNSTIPHPENPQKEIATVVGQSLFIDVELKGKMDLVTPVCYDKECKSSALMLYSMSERKWINLQVS